MSTRNSNRKFLALLATSWLSRSQISGLSRSQISWLSRSQISGLSPEGRDLVKAALNLEGVPKVEKLYTQILKQIKDESLTLDQATFGEANRGKSVCGSPMCVGGTTVWLAGAQGYKLADKVGFALAAQLIHQKSRPDVAAPRYDVYPNEWALAYIEERAAEENGK